MQKLQAALISLLIATIFSNDAQAGAWLQKYGKTQLILNYSHLSTDKFFDTAGDKFSNTKFSKHEFSPYVEYGLTDEWTVGSSLSLQSISSNGVGGNFIDIGDYTLSYTELFARIYLDTGDRYVFSIEPRLKIITNSDTATNPEGKTPIPELKLSYGQSFETYDSFSDMGVTYRKRTEADLADMLKLESTVGTRPFEETPLLFMVQAFYEKNLGVINPTSSSGNYDLLKLQLSAAYEYDDNITLQAGYFNNVYGVNTAAGQGVLISTWLSF